MGLFGPKEYKPENPVKSIRQVSTDTQDIQKEIDTGSALSRKFLIVDELPDTGVTDTIYLVPKENTRKGGTQEIYDEYIYIEETGKFERIGSTEVDLSGYLKVVEVTGTLIAGQTSITLSDESIKSSSTIDVYTNDGTEFVSITPGNGEVTITFEEQPSDISVKVRVS